jgi:multidrug resistance efflux pump
MLIVLVLYLVVLWLVFSRLKLVRWGWVSGTIATAIGVFILAVFSALLNNLTPPGRIVVTGRVVEVTPNVSGQVIAIPIKPNVLVSAGTKLFEIDPAPFRYKVKQLEAALVQAEQQARQLKAAYDQATSNVVGLSAQLAFTSKRLKDMQTLATAQAMSEFREQDTQVQFETVSAQLQAAKAAQTSAKIALDAEIGGENPAVAQIKAQLEYARWELEQTTITAPSNGYATVVTLSVGDRTSPTRSVMSFVDSEGLQIVGMFSPNGFQAIKPGANATLVFDFLPGRRFNAKIGEIPLGVGEGQVSVSGNLARAGSVHGAKEFPALISMPEELDRQQLRIGMPGTARVFAENAGVIGIIGSILIWVSSYTAYL